MDHVWNVNYVQYINQLGGNLHLFKKPDSFLLLLSIDAVGEADDADECVDKSEDRSVSSVLSF